MGVTLRSMAKTLGVSPSFLSGVERGHLRFSMDRIAEYEDAYNVRFIRKPSVEGWAAYTRSLEQLISHILSGSVVTEYDPLTGDPPSLVLPSATILYTRPISDWFEGYISQPEQIGWMRLPWEGTNEDHQ